MSRRDTLLLLGDMLEAAEKISRYTSGMDYDAFSNNDLVIDAVARNFEIIGEAAARVDQEFRHSHPEIEWKYITAFRNRIIHEYFGIDYEIMWMIIQHNVSDLINQLKELIGTA
jgi:uncharacterized protein with HEPN domain